MITFNTIPFFGQNELETEVSSLHNYEDRIFYSLLRGSTLVTLIAGSIHALFEKIITTSICTLSLSYATALIARKVIERYAFLTYFDHIAAFLERKAPWLTQALFIVAIASSLFSIELSIALSIGCGLYAGFGWRLRMERINTM